MIISRIEQIDKKKYKIYIDQEYAFLLYSSDIKKNKLEVGEEISQQLYEEIIEDTVFRRAKQKALAILKFMDRTEKELELKLRQADYTDDIINRTIAYVKDYKYIDDERYTSYYIRSKKDLKSKRQIEMELYRKGIDKSMIDRVLEEEFDGDESAIKKAIAKKTSNIEELTYEEKQKIAASLYRKGFRSEDIRKYLS